MKSENGQIKYIRKLIIALIVSGSFNIILISAFFYWLVRDTPPSPYFEKKPALKKEQQMPLASENGNAELIHYFRSLSFDQLIAKLSNKQLIENGYAQRDIALACLVNFHHFDLAKALLGQIQPEQIRSIVYGRLKNGNPATITVYPALSDQQFQAILDFAGTERWPLTTKGLYWKLKKSGSRADSSLMDAFAMTPEFLAVEMLFNRSEVFVSPEELQKMLLEGTWAMLSDFAEQQKKVQDLSSAKRQHLLLEYIDHQSKMAAYLMLKVEGEFALKKLDDKHVADILRLTTDKTAESEAYARDLLISPRSDAIWKQASAKLYEYAGEEIPEKNLHHQALARFVHGGKKMIEMPVEMPSPKTPQKAFVSKVVTTQKTPEKSTPIKKTTAPTWTKKDRLYIVQEGDSLWKISRRFNVDVDSLRRHNKLKSDALKPGTPLKIPGS